MRSQLFIVVSITLNNIISKINQRDVVVHEHNIDWGALSANTNAIQLLNQNMYEINWECLRECFKSETISYWHSLVYPYNSRIDVYDYKLMLNNRKSLSKNIIENRFNPKNLDKFVSWGFEEFKELEF